jgi:hypothetical protein
MSNGIYLTLEQYKDKDLPITITINGHTYHSQFALATTQTTWFEMGKQHGMELGSDNTYSDKEMSRMHDAWYEEGYEAGKKANGISKKEIPGEYLAHIEEARKQGYADGYKDCREVANCREVAKMLNKYGIDEDGPCNDCKEEPGRDDDDGEPIDDNQSEYDKGYYAGWEDGKNHIMQYI